jgi:hypothetical protein
MALFVIVDLVGGSIVVRLLRLLVAFLPLFRRTSGLTPVAPSL